VAVTLVVHPIAARRRPAIRTHGLGRPFGATWAIQNLDLETWPGEVLDL
jgi:hypothetical protein